MTASYCLSPVLRFNKADWIYLQPPPVGSCCNFIRLRYCMVYLLVLWIDIYVNIYILRDDVVVYRLVLWFQREMTWCLTIRFYVFGAKWIGNDACTLYIFSFSFHMEVICSINVFHLLYRGNLRQSRKPLLYYLAFKEKQLHCKKSLYRVYDC